MRERLARVRSRLSRAPAAALDALMDGAGRRRRGDAPAAYAAGRGSGARALKPGVVFGREAAGKAAVPGVSEAEPPAPRFWTPDRVFRFWYLLLYIPFRLLYRPKTRGLWRLPAEGPALLLPNHVTWIDVFLLHFSARRPIRFLMFEDHYLNPKMHWFVKGFRPIPIRPKDPEAVDRALEEARQALHQGDLVAIFPEGRFTQNGLLTRFKRGMETIARDMDVPILPVHLHGLWGNFFSRKARKGLLAALRSLFTPTLIRFGPPLRNPTADEVREAVEILGAQAVRQRALEREEDLARAFTRAALSLWKREAVVDSSGKARTYAGLLADAVLARDALRRRLRGRSVRVGVMLEPSVDGAVAHAALSLLDRTPVLLDYTGGPEEIERMAREAGVEEIVTSRALMEKLQDRSPGMARIPADMHYVEDLRAAHSPLIRLLLRMILGALRVLAPRLLVRLLSGPPGLERPAAVLFTSGTHGERRRVSLSQLDLLAGLDMVREIAPVGPEDSILAVLPFHHAYGFIASLWFPLLGGHKAVYHGNPWETGAVAEAARRHRPTILAATPALLRRYAREIPPEAFSSLRRIFSGGERLKPEDAAAARDAYGLEPLNVYGATHALPAVTISVPDAINARNGKLEQAGSRAGATGVPLPGVAVRIVDPVTGRALLPSGEGEAPRVGRIYLKGPGLAAPPQEEGIVLEGWIPTRDLGHRDRDGFVYVDGTMERASVVEEGILVPHDMAEDALHRAAGAAERVLAVTAVPDGEGGERLVVLHTGLPVRAEKVIENLSPEMRALWRPSPKDFRRVPRLPKPGSPRYPEELRRLAERAIDLDEP